ncbi:unnamed protein product [Prorocentrum cordatum]|uniref:UDP-N-acetylglucosamine transferase subunit ALG13 n=1 Tax=Prorocentrum cordatum TaxID=2364126 RepID=A0ABN9QH55_9DINO|nr:unnamed protein product [Polarella glacialis]
MTSAARGGRTIFVTVGTTSFDALIEQVDTREFHREARAAGYDRLLVQHGRGDREPKLGRHGEDSADLLEVTAYRFKPSLLEDVEAADLIVSHAGAGSILEALRAGKRLLVVVNPSLMDNHQLELGEAMSQSGFCAMAARPEEVPSAFRAAAEAEPKVYPAPDLARFHRAVQEACGVAPCAAPEAAAS